MHYIIRQVSLGSKRHHLLASFIDICRFDFMVLDLKVDSSNTGNLRMKIRQTLQM